MTKNPLKLMDGGNSTYLREFCSLCPMLWSAPVILENPEMVKRVHHKYIDSGSRYITTFNYSCTPYYSGKKVFDYEKAIRVSGQLAREVVEEASVMATLLGCLPPYSESYREDLIPEESVLNDFYSCCVDGLESNIDIFLGETLSSMMEAELIVKTIRSRSNKPIWLSFAVCHPDRLRCGYPINKLLDKMVELGVSAVLFNCTPIFLIDDILENLLSQGRDAKIEIGVYPNLHDDIIGDGFCLEEASQCSTIDYIEWTPQEFVSKLEEWVNRYHLNIIGGCCGIGPDYIREINIRYNAS